MDYTRQGINKVSTCVDINTHNKLKKQKLEAEKRLKKVERDHLHTSQKYTEARSHWLRLYDKRRRAVNLCYSAANFIDWCNKLAEKLQKALDMLPTTQTTEETINHSLQFSMSNNGKILAQENMMILQQGAQCQKLDPEAIHNFRDISRELYYGQRKMPRRDSRKAIHDLLKEIKEKNKCRDKARSNCTLVCNPTNHDSLRKSVELEIKVLRKLIRELQKDWEEKQHIQQCARDTYSDFEQKVKHLENKKEHLSGQWDEERKYMLGVGTKKKHDRRIGTYPEAKYIKMVNDNLL